MKNKLFLIFLCSAFLIGCSGGGGGGSSPAAAQCTKTIFNTWSDNDSAAFILAGFNFNEPEVYNIFFESGETCQMNLVVTGSSCSGRVTASNSQYVGGGSGDPGCSVFNGFDTYNIVGQTMDLCDGDDSTSCIELY